MLKINSKEFIPIEKQRPDQNKMEAKLRKASKMYEDLFLREMVKSMRKTVHKGGLIKENMAERIFQGKLDDKYVKEWGNKGGIGLGDMIYNQISERFGAAMGIRPQIAKPRGPISFQQVNKMQSLKEEIKTRQTYALEVTTGGNSGNKLSGKREVLSPWAGIILGKQRLDNDLVALKIGHDNGLESTFTYKGSFSPLSVDNERLNLGTKISAGAELGQLAPGSDQLFWQIDKKD